MKYKIFGVFVGAFMQFCVFSSLFIIIIIIIIIIFYLFIFCRELLSFSLCALVILLYLVNLLVSYRKEFCFLCFLLKQKKLPHFSELYLTNNILYATVSIVGCAYTTYFPLFFFPLRRPFLLLNIHNHTSKKGLPAKWNDSNLNYYASFIVFNWVIMF